jgi:eukaryotic-like serine/threonine-protein kinase
VPGGVSVQMSPRSLVWVDRKGREEPIKAPPRPYGSPRISPNGTQVKLGVTDQDGNDIWIWDLARETLRRLTFAPGSDSLALWTPDGARIIFTSDRAGVLNLHSHAADGTGGAERLTTSPNQQFPSSISPDGMLVAGFEWVSFAAPTQLAPSKAWHVRVYPLTDAAAPAQTLFEGTWAEFSPNGRYLAYSLVSGEPGRSEVYVRPFPDVEAGRWQISTTGGTRPAWARSGRELFYLDATNTLTAVPVQTAGPTFSVGKPAKVFDATYSTPFPPRSYDVSADGQRFLMLKESGAGDPNATPMRMVVVEHWFQELRQRMDRR